MAFLQESEWMFLNEIAYNVSFIYSFDEMRRTALKWLHMLVGFDGGVFALVEEEQIKNSISYGLDEKETEIFEKTAGEGNPLQWLQISGRSAAWVQSELLSDEAMEKSDFYQKFYLPQQFRYAMGMNIVFL